MLKIVVDKWYKNKEKLEKALMEDKNIGECSYKYLLKLAIDVVLNDEDDKLWNTDEITQIDDGHYQGNLLFVIPRNTYQPCYEDYIMTYCWYGSCSGCDTLLRLQYEWNFREEDEDEEEIINDYMKLCKDLLCNITKPYQGGWGEIEKYDEVAHG